MKISTIIIYQAFHFNNRDTSDKKLVLSHKYTPVKIIIEIDDKNVNKKQK